MASLAPFIRELCKNAGSVAELVHNCAGYGIQLALAVVFSMGIKVGVKSLVLWESACTGASGHLRTFDRLYDRFSPSKYARAKRCRN